MWGTVLSDPLPIVGSVGRRPADYLMGRMPVPDRLSALSQKGCPPWEPWRIIRRFHRLSARRGLVAYALRTRAPLSCHPKAAIPFDLHVLGLPLAFILSQDQTLRCSIVVLKFCLLNLGFRLDVHPGGLPRVVPSRATPRGVRALLLCWPQTFKELYASVSNPSSNPSFLWKRIAKVRPFYKLASTFFNYF